MGLGDRSRKLLRGGSICLPFNIRKRVCLRVMLAAIAVITSVFAQETTAGLQGVVKDPTGAVIPKADGCGHEPRVDRRQEDGDRSGRHFRFANLPPGTYTLTVTATGFRTFKQENIALEVGHLPTLDVTMEVGAVSETVEGVVGGRDDRRDPEQGADQHSTRQSDESAHAEPLLPERDPVRSRRALRTAAEQQRQREQRIPDQRRQQLRELLPGGRPGDREHQGRPFAGQRADGFHPGSAGEDQRLRSGVRRRAGRRGQRDFRSAAPTNGTAAVFTYYAPTASMPLRTRSQIKNPQYRGQSRRRATVWTSRSNTTIR